MECTDSKHVFVNGVRAVENVNITRVDIDGKITGQLFCIEDHENTNLN